MSGYPQDNTERISRALTSSLNAGISRIDKNLKTQVATLNREIAGLASKYNPVKNQLTGAYRKAARQTEEHIANTGNHTASGYALSKRMNNSNAYNKNMNDINIAQMNEEASLRAKINDAQTNAAAEKEKLRAENAEKKLKYQLDEVSRIDDLNLQYAKHNEDVRMNDAQISRIETQNKNDTDKNRRDNEEHEIFIRYYPEKLFNENEGIKAKNESIKAGTLKTQADTRLTEAKIETEKTQNLKLAKDMEYTDAQIAKIKSTPSTTSKGGSYQGAGSEILSKMTPKDLAQNILEQTGTLHYSPSGAEYYENNKEKAAILLLEWKKKFNLSKQVVNDTAIHLGVQSYI